MISSPGPSQSLPETPVSSKIGETHSSKSSTRNSSFHPFGEDGLTFFDLVDVINPLHHIPIVGPIYRNVTGDSIDNVPRITGSTLFAGPVGAGFAAAEVILEVATGKDVGSHVLSFLNFDESSGKDTTPPSYQAPKNRTHDDFIEIETATFGKKLDMVTDRILTGDSFVSDFSPAIAAINSEAKLNPVVKWARAERAYRASLAALHPPARAVQPTLIGSTPDPFRAFASKKVINFSDQLNAKLPMAELNPNNKQLKTVAKVNEKRRFN